MVIYRDGIEYTLDKGSTVKTKTTTEGHLVEYWKSDGKRVYFVNLKDSVYTAHGVSIAQAIEDAKYKDPKLRPDSKKLVAEIKSNIKNRKISVPEFRLLTGACQEGINDFLKAKGLKSDVKMTLDEFLSIGGEWGLKLKGILT